MTPWLTAVLKLSPNRRNHGMGYQMQARQAAMALAIWVITSAAATSEALAQDDVASSTTGYRWDGLFNAAFLGARFATARQDFNAQGTSTGNFTVDGVTGGLGFGYGQKFGRFLIGAEADISGNSSDGSAHAPNPTYNYETENSWLGILQSRIGYDFGLPLLPYATAGFAVGDVRVHTYRQQNFGTFIDYTKTEPGWTAGAGIETSLSARWGVRAEYRYVSLANSKGTGSAGNPISASFDENSVRIGLVLHWL